MLKTIQDKLFRVHHELSESNKTYHKLSEALTLYKLFTTYDKIYDEHTFTQGKYTTGLNRVIDVCISNHKLYVRLFDWKKTAKCPIDKSSADKQKLGYVNRLFKALGVQLYSEREKSNGIVKSITYKFQIPYQVITDDIVYGHTDRLCPLPNKNKQ